MAGYSLVTVPTGLAAGVPIAVSLRGTAGSDAALVEIARDRTSGPRPRPRCWSFV